MPTAPQAGGSTRRSQRVIASGSGSRKNWALSSSIWGVWIVAEAAEDLIHVPFCSLLHAPRPWILAANRLIDHLDGIAFLSSVLEIDRSIGIIVDSPPGKQSAPPTRT